LKANAWHHRAKIESLKETTYQNSNIPAVGKDVEAVVSNILSSKFPEVCFTLEFCDDR
jgi:hypothetical protein